jgi:ankyrin repeat protein
MSIAMPLDKLTSESLEDLDQYDCNRLSGGGIPLAYLIKIPHMEKVKMLLEKGADPLFNNNGKSPSPLDVCCMLGEISILELLLKYIKSPPPAKILHEFILSSDYTMGTSSPVRKVDILNQLLKAGANPHEVVNRKPFSLLLAEKIISMEEKNRNPSQLKDYQDLYNLLINELKS